MIMKHVYTFESFLNEAAKEVVLSNEILDFLQERGIIAGTDAQKVHKDLTAFLKEKGVKESAISEKKEELYIAHVDDSRKPGGSDKEIKNDYNLEVRDRDNSGFDIVGSKEDIQAFVDDYGIILDGEIELHESAGYIEVMDLTRVANALGEIQRVWAEWKSGPATEPSDIKPAQKDLKGWIDRWLKDNIK